MARALPLHARLTTVHAAPSAEEEAVPGSEALAAADMDVDLALAFEAYQMRRCSLAQAVIMAGMSVSGFLECARANGILMSYTEGWDVLA